MSWNNYNGNGTCIMVYGYNIVKGTYGDAISGINTLLNTVSRAEIMLYANGTVEQKPNKLIMMNELD